MTRASSRPSAPPADGQVCTLFAVDIADFTGPHRDGDIRAFLRDELYHMLEKSFNESGISWSRCAREDRGDGVLVVLPSSVACTGVIDPLPGRLRGLIRRHNHVAREEARIQLRAAVNIGPVEHDGHGFISPDIDHLFRMLEARYLKHALTGTGAELGLIISDYVYRNVVCRHPSLVSPGAFEPIRFQVKKTRAPAWTYLPGFTASRGVPVG